jgi:hypothetical protein
MCLIRKILWLFLAQSRHYDYANPAIENKLQQTFPRAICHFLFIDEVVTMNAFVRDKNLLTHYFPAIPASYCT